MRHLLSIMLVLLVLLVGLTSATHAQTDARIIIPALDIDQSIGFIPIIYTPKSTWDTRNLGTNVGMLEGSSPLDGTGTIVLAGHYDLPNGAPGAFYRLNTLVIGDTITLLVNGEEQSYVIYNKRLVAKTDVEAVFANWQEHKLVLLTCAGVPYRGTYLYRLVIYASPQ